MNKEIEKMNTRLDKINGQLKACGIFGLIGLAALSMYLMTSAVPEETLATPRYFFGFIGYGLSAILAGAYFVEDIKKEVDSNG